jgi:hypothetical protein
MPAILLAKLKIQAANLAEKFDQPEKFVKELHALCDVYAERTRRPGQAGEPPPLLSTYKLPSPVLRQVLKEITPYLRSQRQAALRLADALWAEPFLEFRLLAASVLGSISPQPVETLLERVQAWTLPGLDDRLLTALISDGLARVRAEETALYLDLIKTWLESQDVFSQRLGLRALLFLLNSSSFENMPLAMRLLAPVLRAGHSRLKPDLLDVIQALALRSPRETAFFLRQNLAVKNDNPGTPWLIRNSLGCFPLEMQASLRQALRNEI